MGVDLTKVDLVCTHQVIGLSLKLLLSTEKRDLLSHEWHKTVKIGEKLTYLCLYLLFTIHECDKS